MKIIWEREYKMRVLVIMNSVDVKLGGGIIQVILNYKNQINEKNVYITFAINCVKDSGIPELLSDKNSNFVQLPNKKKKLLKYCISLNRLMKNNQYDVVHVHGNSANMLLELGIAKINKIKCRIAHSHNSTCKNPKLNKILMPIFKKTYTKALACSNLAGEWLFGKGNYEVLNNAIDLNNFKYSYDIREEYRKKIKVGKKTKVIGHVGNINEQKNQEFLIKVFSLYNKENRDSVLLLIGDGPLKEDVFSLVKKLDLESKVLFLGIQNDVNNWMQAMDIFIFPSKWEGFGMVLIEAQASGLPIIASNVVPSIIKIRNNVFFMDLYKNTLVEWKEQMSKLLKEENVREINENEFYNYDIKVQGKKLLKFYEYNSK